MSWKTAVIGAGAWGTAMAVLLAKKGHTVTLWENFPELCQQLIDNKENVRYLPGLSLDIPNLTLSSQLSSALHTADLVILATPSKFLEDFLPQLAPHLRPNQVFLSLVKGILPRPVPRLLLEDIKELLPTLDPTRMAVLSGPNFAKEIAQDLPAATVIAGQDMSFLQELQLYLSTPNFRVYTNQDLIGVQLGGIMKNIIAIASGLLDGLQLGYNAKSSLVVRGISEMSRLFIAMGAQQETLYGLSGLGDLIGTCTSPLSRNWWAGTQLASGLSYSDLQRTTGTTVEGIDSLPGLLKLAQNLCIELPISQQIHAVVFQQKDIRQALHELMSRKLRTES
jgi:glycerol-3-phosphate dehydrogenase (NAD(P)+)